MIAIRPATPDDLDAIVAFAEALGREDGLAHGVATNPDWASQHGHETYRQLILRPTQLMLVAADDAPLGYLNATVREATSWRTATVAEIVTLFVDPAHRSRGVGHELIAEFRRWAIAQRADRLAVSAFARNERAIRFYQREGFLPYEVMLECPAVTP